MRRATTAADDQYLVLQGRRDRRQSVGEIAKHMQRTIGRAISHFTVARRFLDGCLFPRYVPLKPAHHRRFLWCQEHKNRSDLQWDRVLFPDESRFSLTSDSGRIRI